MAILVYFLLEYCIEVKKFGSIRGFYRGEIDFVIIYGSVSDFISAT